MIKVWWMQHSIHSACVYNESFQSVCYGCNPEATNRMFKDYCNNCGKLLEKCSCSSQYNNKPVVDQKQQASSILDFDYDYEEHVKKKDDDYCKKCGRLLESCLCYNLCNLSCIIIWIVIFMM